MALVSRSSKKRTTNAQPQIDGQVGLNDEEEEKRESEMPLERDFDHRTREVVVTVRQVAVIKELIDVMNGAVFKLGKIGRANESLSDTSEDEQRVRIGNDCLGRTTERRCAASGSRC